MRWINKITAKRTHNIVPKKKSVLRKILVSGKLLTTVQPLKGYFFASFMQTVALSKKPFTA
ncbi:hypothetical protein [Robertmurraya sp. FSL R5-0851]|uniref:hypothetical protein n=1 Tax=Robertmurraya sp. FSL R5-0851 TaxID=2921584 RepID=UPI001369757E